MVVKYYNDSHETCYRVLSSKENGAWFLYHVFLVLSIVIPELSLTSVSEDTDRKVARKLVKYIFAKCILQRVDQVITVQCDECQHNYLSQTEHECLYCGSTASGQRATNALHFKGAAERINMALVEKAARAVAKYLTSPWNMAWMSYCSCCIINYSFYSTIMPLRTYQNTFLGCVFLVLAAIILYLGNASFVTTANIDLFFPKWRQQQQHQNEAITVRTERIKSSDQEIPPADKSVEKIHPRSTTTLEPTRYRTVERQSTTHALSEVNVKQYLLPIRTKAAGGCNSQFQRFKNAIMMSLLTNRTLVTTPFFLHGGHVHGYTAEHVRPFNYTFDVNSLAKLLPLATVESYKLVCNRSNKKVIGWRVVAEDYEHCKAKLFHDIMGIDLPAVDDLIDMQYGFEETLSKIKDVKCVAFTTTTKFLPKFDDRSEKRDIRVEISKRFVRSPRVTQIAEDLTEYMCNGVQYISFHWRNKSAETP
ncbi:uncharacterized protein [Ptychodera flava]|uniref:uncharacterized protein n=1 Tax=Ptychodera flava TaxID=63121 RepID=UPI00396AAC9C